MQDLTLVGVHDDGEHLVLAGADGLRFRVRVDEPLRAAVRRDRARLGQLQIELDGRLRPRDIQARIRAGQTADEVAEAAGLPVEHVRRYEGPVLAEREFVVRQARLVRIRRAGSPPGGSPTLGDLVAERLAAREVPDADATWDAWRSEDGAWLVVLTFTAGSRQRQARWTYDASLRHVTAQDDEARWLTEDEPEAAATPRRLVPIRSSDPLRSGDGVVRDRVYDVEADGGVRPAAQQEASADPSTERAKDPSTERAKDPSTVDLLDNLRERRGRRQRLATPGELDDLDPFETAHPAGSGLRPREQSPADPLLRQEPPAAHPPQSRPDLALDAEILVLPDGPVTRDGDPAAEPLATTPAPAAVAGSRRGKRASVPSWDDIVFGSRRE